jgi:hypothetical protein
MRNLLIKTHNDAMSLIREAASGADVKIEKIIGAPGEDTSGMRRYSISLPNGTTPAAVHVYALPFSEYNIRKTIKDTLLSLSDRG